jgi:hypothetical protein
LPGRTADSNLNHPMANPSTTVTEDRSEIRLGEKQEVGTQRDLAEMIQTEVQKALFTLLGEKHRNYDHGTRSPTTNVTDSSDEEVFREVLEVLIDKSCTM